jgi:c(7)-type cytochrome triheme protein
MVLPAFPTLSSQRRGKEDSTVKLIRLAVLTAVLGAASTLLLASPAAAQKGPADFTFPEAKGAPGVVTFSHQKHIGAGAKCTDCHTKIFKMKKGASGELTMAKMKEGQQCGACHDGKKEIGGKVVFATDDKANCEKCHKK